MSENNQAEEDVQKPMDIPLGVEDESKRPPGFCSATCVTRECMRKEIAKPRHDVKTSDMFLTCNLPPRFEYPHWFNGYGCQLNKQHPFYRTTSNDYGWYAPGIHSVPTTYRPRNQKFSSDLARAGMYRNYSLNMCPNSTPLD